MQTLLDLSYAGKNVRRIIPLLTRPRTLYEISQILGLAVGTTRASLRTLRYAGLLHISIRVKKRKQVRVYVLNHCQHLLVKYEVSGNKQPRMERNDAQQVLGVWI
jgi:predicted transcriptional regulator